MAFNPVLLAAMSDVRATESGLASGIVNTSFMMGGALVLLVGLGASAADRAGIEGVALVILVVAAAEAAVGLALVVAAARRNHTTRIDELRKVRG